MNNSREFGTARWQKTETHPKDWREHKQQRASRCPQCTKLIEWGAS